MNNKEESKSKLAGLWNKTVDLSKKAADEIQKGAKEIANKAKDELHEQRLKKYNPLVALCYNVYKNILYKSLKSLDTQLKLLYNILIKQCRCKL